MNYKTFELVSAGCLNLEGLLGAWIQIYRLFVSVDLEVLASVFLLDFAEQSTGMAHEHRNDVSTCGGGDCSLTAFRLSGPPDSGPTSRNTLNKWLRPCIFRVVRSPAAGGRAELFTLEMLGGPVF